MSALEKLERMAALSASDQGTAVQAQSDLADLVLDSQAALSAALEAGDLKTVAEMVVAAAGKVDEIVKVLCLTPPAPEGDDLFGLAVLTTAQRDRMASTGVAMPGGHFPIPDKGHLQAAIARYKQGAHAGQDAGKIKAHIVKRAKALGVTDLNLSRPVLPQALNGDVIAFAAAVMGGVAMQHSPMTGTHTHDHPAMPHVHGHEHSHMADNEHGGDMHGQNPGSKAWTAAGEAGWRKAGASNFAKGRQGWGVHTGGSGSY